MKPITPVDRHELEDRTTSTVDVWRRSRGNASLASTRSSDFLRSGDNQDLLTQVKRVIASANSTIMLSCPQIGRDFAVELVAAARRGVRIYILLSDKGFSSWLGQPPDELADLCLCRRSTRGVPTLVLADAERDNTRPTGGILLSPGAPLNIALTEGVKIWGLVLSSLQIQKMAELFSWIFWNSQGERSETRAMKHLNAPVIAGPPEGATLKLFGNDRMINIAEGSGPTQVWQGMESIGGLNSYGLSAKALQMLLGNEIKKILEQALLPECEEVNGGREIHAGGCAPGLVFLTEQEGEDGWLLDWIPDPELQLAHSTVLRLTSRQAIALRSEYMALVNGAEWTLARGVPIGHLKVGEPVLLYPGNLPVTVEEVRVVDLESVRVDPWWDGQLESYAPPKSRRPEVEGIVQRINWTWRNEAAVVPESAKYSPDEIKMKDVQTAAAAACRQLFEEYHRVGENDSRVLVDLQREFGDPNLPIRRSEKMRRVLALMENAKAELDDLSGTAGADSELSAVRGKKKKHKIKIPNQSLLPMDDLPAAGRLFCSSGIYFVVVEDWDDVPTAVEEAKRLEASLCVPRRTRIPKHDGISGGENA